MIRERKITGSLCIRLNKTNSMQNPDEVCLPTPMYMNVVEDQGGNEEYHKMALLRKLSFNILVH